MVRGLAGLCSVGDVAGSVVSDDMIEVMSLRGEVVKAIVVERRWLGDHRMMM